MPQRPPRDQAGQERPGRNRGRPGRGRPGHGPDAGTAPRPPGPADPRGRPGDQRDEGEERRVAEPDQLVEGGHGAAVDLGRGVLPGQRAQRGGEAPRPGPVHRAQRRADDRRRDRRAEPAQHGRGQVGQQDQPRLAGGGRGQQPAGVARPAHHDHPQMRLRPVTRRRDHQRRAGREPGDDPAQLPVGRTGGRRPGGLPRRARRGGKVAEVDDGQRAAGQGGRGQLGRGREIRADPAGWPGPAPRQGRRRWRTGRSPAGRARRSRGTRHPREPPLPARRRAGPTAGCSGTGRCS